MEIRDQELTERLRDLLSLNAGQCPDEEILASWLEAKLLGTEREKVGAHILSCDLCRDALAASSGIADKVRVPARAVKRAVELAPIGEPPWEIVVKFVSDAIQVIKNSGDKTQYFAPAFATVRGPGLAPGSLVAFTRRLDGMEVEVEIERVAPMTSDIKITARSVKDSGTPRNLRANLYRNDEELMSYLLQAGSLTFEKVPFGAYKIDFSRRGIRIGEISLEIKGE